MDFFVGVAAMVALCIVQTSAMIIPQTTTESGTNHDIVTASETATTTTPSPAITTATSPCPMITCAPGCQPDFNNVVNGCVTECMCTSDPTKPPPTTTPTTTALPTTMYCPPVEEYCSDPVCFIMDDNPGIQCPECVCPDYLDTTPDPPTEGPPTEPSPTKPPPTQPPPTEPPPTEPPPPPPPTTPPPPTQPPSTQPPPTTTYCPPVGDCPNPPCVIIDGIPGVQCTQCVCGDSTASTTPEIVTDCIYPAFKECPSWCYLDYDTGGQCPLCQCTSDTNPFGPTPPPPSTSETPIIDTPPPPTAPETPTSTPETPPTPPVTTRTTTPCPIIDFCNYDQCYIRYAEHPWDCTECICPGGSGGYPCNTCPYGCDPEYNLPGLCPSGCQCPTGPTQPPPTPPPPTQPPPTPPPPPPTQPPPTEPSPTQTSTTTSGCPPLPTCYPDCGIDYDMDGCAIGCYDCGPPPPEPPSTTITPMTTPTPTITTYCPEDECPEDRCYRLDPIPEHPCGRCDCPFTSTAETTTGTSQNTVISPICEIPKCPRGWYLVYGDNPDDCPKCKRHTCEDITCDEDEKCKMVGKKPRCFKKRMFSFLDLLLLLRIRPDDDDD